MGKVLSMAKGDVIVREGEESDSIFFVQKGRLNVLIRDANDKMTIVNHIEVGELVGEMAYIEKKPRSATVIADCPTELVLVSHSSFEKSLDQLPPWLKTFVNSMMRRLRENNEILKEKK